MDSQIFCMPQKYGWSTVEGTSWERHHQQKQYLNQKSACPYPKFPNRKPPGTSASPCKGDPRVNPDGPGTSRGMSLSEDLENRHTLHTYSTRYRLDYGPHSVPPYVRPLPPKTHEYTPDAVTSRRKRYLPSMALIYPTKGTPANDSDRGFQLMCPPGTQMWGEAPKRIPFWSYVGARHALPPIRLRSHDPTHEKERWDNIKTLDANRALAYGYTSRRRRMEYEYMPRVPENTSVPYQTLYNRKNMVGYGGHCNMVEHMTSDVTKDLAHENKSMVSTAQASYRELPEDMYQHSQLESENKHKGPLSRMVTLTHPFNPFTQQTAFSNVGATSATGSR